MSASGSGAGASYPPGGTPSDIAVSSAVVANAQAQAVIPGAAGTIAYLAMIVATFQPSTAGGPVTLTAVSGALTLNIVVDVPAGATALAVPIVIPFERPIPSPAANTPWTVTLPPIGAGSTAAAVVATGYRA